jgi:hypothetical protein
MPEFPTDLKDDPVRALEYKKRRTLIYKTIGDIGGKWLRDPTKVLASKLFSIPGANLGHLMERMGEKKFEMPEWGWRTFRNLKVSLGVDLKSITDIYYDGAIRRFRLENQLAWVLGGFGASRYHLTRKTCR